MNQRMTIQSVLALLLLAASTLIQNCETTAGQLGGIIGSRGGTTMATETRVADGNTFDASYDCSTLPTGLPSGWGAVCNRHVIGAAPTDGATLRARTGLASTTGYFQQFEFYVGNSTMTPGGIISLGVGKEISHLDFDNPATPIAFRAHLANIAGELKIQFFLDSGGDEQSWQWSGTVAAQTVYEVRQIYDLVADTYKGYVNGVEVASAALTSVNPQSIGTSIIGSSGSSGGRDIEFFTDRIFEAPIGASTVAPSGVSVSIPSNGATDIDISATITCTGTNVTGWHVRYETTNPPSGAYTSLGSSPSLGPVSLANNTTYYVQCKAENAIGSTESAVTSFTTVAATSTGTHPTLLINASREATWTAMRADYLEDPSCLNQATTNERVACELYKGAVTLSTTAYGNIGLNDAWLANVPGNDATFHCDRAWGKGLGAYSSGTIAGGDPNNNREYFTDWVMVYDFCYQSWSQARRDEYLTKLNALASTVLSSSWYGNGWRCGDVDQPIGNAFGIWALYESTKSYNPDIVTLVAAKASILGAYNDPDAYTCRAGQVNTHARNMIKAYFSEWADGGAWFEGSEYSGSAFLGILGCEALRTTDAGDAPCTEIDAWVDDHATYITHALTRDSRQVAQTGDLQVDLVRNEINSMRTNGRGHTILALTGLLPDGSVRQHLWRQYLNLRTTHGSAIVNPTVPSGPARSLMLANPYITAAADLSALSPCFQSLDMAGQTGNGIHIWNDGTSSDATQFWVQLYPQNPHIDHATMAFGVDQMWRKGQWIRTHPFSYDGVAGHTAEGLNSVMIEGLSTFPRSPYYQVRALQSKKVNGYTCGSDYLAVSGTQGGSYHPQVGVEGTTNYFFSIPRFVHEDTATYVYLPSATKDYDSVVMLRRVNAIAPTNVTNYPSQTCFNVTCFNSAYYLFAEQERIANFPRWSWFNHHWTEPTVNSLNTTWTLSDGQIAQLAWLTPDTVTITKENLTASVNFCTTTSPGPSTCPSLAERRWRTKVESSAADAQWNMLAQVLTVRDSDATAPTITELSITGNCAGVLITRPGNDDRIVLWNSVQGDDISQTLPTPTQANAVLSTARYHKTKTCTIPWTQATASAKVLSLDMNPTGITWTSNLDAAGAVSATPDSSGVKEISVSGTGAHSLVLTGS
jgi:hypothetical protein